MKETTKKVIAKLREANKCGRYSDATVERILEEVLEEEIKSMECCSKEEAYKEEETEPYTFREMLEGSELDLDAKYKQVLIIAEDNEGGIGTTYVENLVNLEERLEFHYAVKHKLKDIILEDVPKYVVDMYEKYKAMGKR